jgi:hypothetical protein
MIREIISFAFSYSISKTRGSKTETLVAKFLNTLQFKILKYNNI